MVEKEPAFGHVDLFQTSPSIDCHLPYIQGAIIKKRGDCPAFLSNHKRSFSCRSAKRKFFGKCQEEFRQVKETALQRKRTEPAAGGTGDL